MANPAIKNRTTLITAINAIKPRFDVVTLRAFYPIVLTLLVRASSAYVFNLVGWCGLLGKLLFPHLLRSAPDLTVSPSLRFKFSSQSSCFIPHS